MKFGVIACLCGAALMAVGCADGPNGLTSPSATSAARSSAAAAPLSAAPRSGDLHVTKECTQYTGLAGAFCTITSSNVKAIEVGSRVVYAEGEGAGTLDTDVTLDTPGPGNNKAFGHCTLDLTTGLGLCTFAGGTGTFEHFSATAHVAPPAPGSDDWFWDGTFSLDPRD